MTNRCLTTNFSNATKLNMHSVSLNAFLEIALILADEKHLWVTNFSVKNSDGSSCAKKFGSGFSLKISYRASIRP